MTSTKPFKEFLEKLWENSSLIDFYLKESQNIWKKDTIIRVCDFDDTLFSRDKQLQDKNLRENRAEKGINFIVENYGIHEFSKKYYRNKTIPQEILSLLKKDSDIILTAWLIELQQIKLREAWLWEYNIKIVYSWKDKILETIRYVLFELKYIPSEIIVYEDRPQFFIEYRELIEWVLWCKLTIMYVEMDGNDGYKKIEEK